MPHACIVEVDIGVFVVMESCSGQYFTTTYSKSAFLCCQRSGTCGVHSTPRWSVGHVDNVEALLSVCFHKGYLEFREMSEGNLYDLFVVML